MDAFIAPPRKTLLECGGTQPLATDGKCRTRPMGGAIYRCTMRDEFISYSFLLAVTVAGVGLLVLAFV
jgi:hypothetical protein